MNSFTRSLLVLVVSCLLFSPSSAQSTSYKFTTIDYQPSGTRLLSINNDGEIVGENFLYSGGVFTPISDPDATLATYAKGINDAGEIVGGYGDSTGSHGFLLSGQSYTTLSVPGSYSTTAYDINNNSGVQIVGHYQDSTYKFHGFILSNGSYTPINYGTTFTEALGINDAGQIVGVYGYNGAERGFLLSDGVYTPLDFNWANGINNAGQIVGTRGFESFLLSGKTYIPISFPGASSTEARGINDAGQIVGDYFMNGKQHGFLATPVPLPGGILLLGTGLLGLGGFSWRRVARKVFKNPI